MKAICSLALVLLAVVATPASADRPFGGSDQGPPKTTQAP